MIMKIIVLKVKGTYALN